MSIFDWLKTLKNPAGRQGAIDSWPLAEAEQFITAWKSIAFGENKSWVLFRNGTCVFLREPSRDLTDQAVRLMKQYGPVHAGSSAGDFGVVSLRDYPGWVITSHHDDILTYVTPDEVPGDFVVDFAIGGYGRMKRDKDASDLTVIHVEDRRSHCTEKLSQ